MPGRLCKCTHDADFPFWRRRILCELALRHPPSRPPRLAAPLTHALTLQEDLTPENVGPILDAYQQDQPPPPGPQHGGPDLPEANGVRAGPQPGGPQGHTGQRRGCEGPMGKTSLIGEPTGPQCRQLEKQAAA